MLTDKAINSVMMKELEGSIRCSRVLVKSITS